MSYGSIFNRLMDNSATKAPEVGDGATVLLYTDRHAATITEVKHFKSGARKGQVSSVTVQEDTATRTDNHGMSDSQSYTYTPDPDGTVREFKVSKDGSFKGLLIGHRAHYYDYSF